jgi:AAA domain/TrwC relaxase
MTKAADKVRSVQPHEWYRVQSFVAAVYQAEIAYRARERGYELEHGKNHSTGIKGYTEEYLRAMSARTEEIEREKAEKGLVGAEADERVNKRLREAKLAWAPEALWTEHRAQAEKYGNDPAAVVAKARLSHSYLLPEKERLALAQEAVSFAKNRLFEGQAVVEHYELLRDALRYGLGYLRLQDVEHAFELRLAQAKREFIPVGHVRSNAPGERFTTVEMRKLEIDTIHLALKGQGTTEPIAPDLTRDEFRDSYKRREMDGKTIELSDYQMWMAWNVLTSPDQFIIVRGSAGAGKSTAMQPIGEVAERLRSRGYQVRGVAATGGAALNLAEVGIRSETLQAHLVRGVDRSAAKRLYIVDEGSLVGTRQFHQFMQSVRLQDRVIIAYDPRQHEAVEAGRIIEELEQAGVRTFRLEKIVRQRNTPELLEAIECFANGRTMDGLGLLEKQGRIIEHENRKERFAAIAQEFAKDPLKTRIVSPDNRSIGEINLRVRGELQSQGLLSPDRYEANVLVGRRDVKAEDRKRAGTYHVDDWVRFGKSVGTLGVRSGDYGRVLQVEAEQNLVTVRLGSREVTYNPRVAYGIDLYTSERRMVAVGERVQLTRAWKPGKVANREAGTIVGMDREGNAQLKLDRGPMIEWNAAMMPHLDYAYARTSYSEQSTTAERVLLHLDTGDSSIRSLMDKRLVYVGSSRAERDLVVFTDDREHLLGEQSPANRISLKPKALSREEIHECVENMCIAV